MSERPQFLKDHAASSAKQLVLAYQILTSAEAIRIETWLVVADKTGSLSASETYLLDWINEEVADFEE